MEKGVSLQTTFSSAASFKNVPPPWWGYLTSTWPLSVDKKSIPPCYCCLCLTLILSACLFLFSSCSFRSWTTASLLSLLWRWSSRWWPWESLATIVILVTSGTNLTLSSSWPGLYHGVVFVLSHKSLQSFPLPAVVQSPSALNKITFN